MNEFCVGQIKMSTFLYLYIKIGKDKKQCFSNCVRQNKDNRQNKIKVFFKKNLQ